jgi:hypothetical protein
VRFDVTTPCKGCPFRVKGKHVVRLSRHRVLDVAGNMLDPQGATFTCHEAVHGRDAGRSYRPGVDDVHCAGALIFAERNDNQTRMMHIAERIGLYDPEKFRSKKQRQLIFTTIEAMLETALEGR